MNFITYFLKGMKKRRIKKTAFMVLLITLVTFSIGSFLNKQIMDTTLVGQKNYSLNFSDFEQSFNSIQRFKDIIELNVMCQKIQTIDLGYNELELGVDLSVNGTVDVEVLSCRPL